MTLGALSGRCIIVTGAGRGIGRSIALGLAAAGADVCLVDRSRDDLRQAAQEAQAVSRASSIAAVEADITSEADTVRVVEQALGKFGSIYGLVNNAGIGRAWLRSDFLRRPIRFWEIGADDWRRFMDVNANGFFLMTRAVIDHFRSRDEGRVITVTTSIDTMIREGSVGYGGSKAAVEATMATLAEDLKGTRLTANIVVPGGPVNTPAMPDDGSIPRSAFIQPEAMVPPIHWLLSDEGGAVTGRRFIAARWDASLPPAQTIEHCSDPIAWPQLGSQTRFPTGLAA